MPVDDPADLDCGVTAFGEALRLKAARFRRCPRPPLFKDMWQFLLQQKI